MSKLRSRDLPPVPDATVDSALGPMLASELRSLVSEMRRHRREGEAMEQRILGVLDKVAARAVELAEGKPFAVARVVKLVRP